MDQYEKVERVAKQTGATFEEAKHALEACNWDMLDATILLEKQSKTVKNQKVFSTDYEAQPGYRNVAATAEVNNGSGKKTRDEINVGDKIKEFFKKSHVNHLVLRHNDKEIVSLPIWAAALILICIFKLSVILLVISLICGCKLTFEGPDCKKMESVNKAVNTAGQAMSGAASAIKTSFVESYNKVKNEGTAANTANATAGETCESTVKSAQETENTVKTEEKEVFSAEIEIPESGEKFEKEDFRAIAEGFTANSVSTEDGKITLEL